MRAYMLRIQLIIIDFFEKLARYLPVVISSPFKHFLEKWRGKVNLEIRQEVTNLVKEIQRLREEISEMRSVLKKFRNHPPRRG